MNQQKALPLEIVPKITITPLDHLAPSPTLGSTDFYSIPGKCEVAGQRAWFSRAHEVSLITAVFSLITLYRDPISKIFSSLDML